MASQAVLLVCVVALAVVTQCIQGACPEGCTCDDIVSGLAVNCNGLQELPQEFPEMTTKITICGLQAKEIPSKAFCLLTKLQTLEIFTSRVQYIRPFAFSGLKDVAKLGIYFSHVSFVEELAFSHLQNVSHIEIHNTTIREIRAEAFSDISDVLEISFNNVTVNTIQALSFTRVRRVAMFSIRNSHIETFETGAFYLSSFAFFFVHGNTFDNIMCGSLDVAISETMNQVSFGGNTMCCSCNMLWMFQIERKQNLLPFLEGLECTNPTSEEKNKTLVSYNWSDFPCQDYIARRTQGSSYCPSIVLREEINIGASTNGNRTAKSCFSLYGITFLVIFMMKKMTFI